MKLLSVSAEMMSSQIDRIGASSIITIVGINSAAAAEVVELSNSWIMADWVMADWALLISMIGGLTFIANNLFNMYLSCKKNKKKDL